MKMKSFKYIERFFKYRSAIDIVSKLGKIDLKEINECYAMFEFLRNMLVYSNKGNVVVFDVGCGKRPTFSLMSAHFIKNWEFIAIDPNLEIKDYKTERLSCYKCKVEEFDFSKYTNRTKIGVYIHSHAPAINVFDYLFIMPCCIDNLPKNILGFFKIDTNIWYNKNKIYYYDLRRKNEKA